MPTPIRTEERLACPSCGCAGELLFSDLEDRLFDAPGQWSLRRCSQSGCGSVWLDPLPAAEDLHLLYASYFTHEEREASTGRRALEAAYRLLNFLPALALGLRPAQRDIESMFTRDLSPGRLLDVGCGDGGFLARMRDRRWQTLGIDFDEAALEHARKRHGLDLRQGDLIEAEFPEDSFDVVTASHVIEHVVDPVSFLRECRRITRASGRVVITTPNLGSLGFAKHGQHWVGLDPPRHLQLFDEVTLLRCAREAGATRARSFTTAANAHTMFAGSMGIESATTHQSRSVAPVHVLRPVKALLWQYREQLALRAHPSWGEEAVLVIDG